MPRLALATSRPHAELIPEDRRLRGELARLGVEACAAVWDDPEQDWSGFDGVLIRTCWDYHSRTGEFLGWISRLEALGVALCNPPALLRWNHDKRYLLELDRSGLPVVPIIRFAPGGSDGWRRQLRSTGWRDLIVKPAVSASAEGLHRMGPAEVEAYLAGPAGRTAQLIQPYREEIVGEGEWSLAFFAGQFSHAVLKRPRPGDFRVQKDFGGSVQTPKPSAEVVRQAAAVLEVLPVPAWYARVDGIRRAGRLEVLEVELIEPELYLEVHPEAARRFAGVLSDWLSGRG